MGRAKQGPRRKGREDKDDEPKLSRIERINKVKSKIVRSKLYHEYKKEKKVRPTGSCDAALPPARV